MIYAKAEDNNAVPEQKEILSTNTTEVKSDDVKKPQPTAEEIQAALEKEATKLGITVDELKAKLAEKALEKETKKLENANTSDTKTNNINTNTKLSDLRAAFKAIKKDHVAKKALLAEIAKAKQEAKDERIDVFVKGDGVDFDVPPIVKNGRTLIPVRAIMDKFGAAIAWDEATSTVTITKDDTVIKLVIGSDVALVNGVEVKLDVPAEVSNNRTLVPIRFIAQTLKQKVEYDDASKTIIIDDTTTPDATTPDATTPDTTTPDTTTPDATTPDTTTQDTTTPDATTPDATTVPATDTTTATPTTDVPAAE